MFTIPRSKLPEEFKDSKMKCKPSGLPEIISFIEGKNGCEVFHDGKMAIVIISRLQFGSVQKCAYVLFFEQRFSNFAAADGLKIKIGDQYLNLPCSEALFQMMKAAQSDDWDSFWKIYNAETPKICKGISRNELKGFVDEHWKAVSYETMVEILRLKLASEDFFQTLVKLAKVFDEKNVTVVRFAECSTRDEIYSIGIDILEAVKILQNADVNDVFKPDFLLQKGENRLGKALDVTYQLFMRCGGATCQDAPALVEKYSAEFGKDFYVSMLQVEEDVGFKRLKTDETDEDAVTLGRSVSMAVERTGSMAARSGSMAARSGSSGDDLSDKACLV